jgi:hypothetical protein
MTSRSIFENQISTWLSPEMHVGMSAEKIPHDLALMIRQVVQNDVDLRRRHALDDFAGELYKPQAGMTCRGLAQRLAGLRVQSLCTAKASRGDSI